ncbi:FtsH protease activity modulator HflK [candidate division CSSED10-310 bacterium]|uniref:Protein HflK n=1 Tax=candidate division CSSED10-310 bacterium TaxID=2855610 RepID=A0ABV6Z0N8_UNCC1
MEESLQSELESSFKNTRKFLKFIGLGLVFLYLCSGIYSISSNEIGVLQRFGRVLDEDVRPGIHFALPWPIDKINRVPVKEVKRIFIDDFYEQGKNAELFYRFTGLSSNCQTGDNNIVTINCVLQYTIARPRDYLFNIDRIDIALRSMATNTLVHCLATLSVDEILTYGKKQIENNVKSYLQQQLDSLQSGINISFVELKDVRPPSIIQHYFDDVINAKIDKRKMISKAESYQNEKLPAANAQATRLLQQAKGYKNKTVAEAEGETKRFLAQLNEYKKNPQITKQRLYLEFINRIYPQLEKKIVVDAKTINLRLMQSDK